MASINYSAKTVETLGEILNRKTSAAQLLKETQSGLNHIFENDHAAPEELIFELFKVPNKDEACIGKLLSMLKSYGLREDDPRLRPMMDMIKVIELEQEALTNEMKDPRHWNMSRAQFKSCISGSLVLITQALRNNLIVPSWQEFTDAI
uniref:Glutaminase EF-hand domain-containing protein n=1 Tax=Plectus sambesii TaxID=2011161 RepID=A0A914XNI1_9BILA